MKHAYKSFTLYPDETFRVQGKDTYFTYQNTGTNTATIKGSNDALTWFDIASINASATVQRVHSYTFLKVEGNTEVKGTRGHTSSSSVVEYSEAQMPLPTSVVVGTEVFNTTYQVKMRSNGTSWVYLGIGTATLSVLPLAASVPSGTKFNITDLGTGSAVFKSNGSHWLPVGEVLLFVDNVGATLTTVTTETVLSTFTLNKKLASPNMTIVVNSLWSLTNSANIKTPRIRFGGIAGTAYFNHELTTSSSLQSECLIRFRNALNLQVGMAGATSIVYGSSSLTGATSSLDVAVNNAEIVISGQLANAADNLTLRAYTITLRG